MSAAAQRPLYLQGDGPGVFGVMHPAPEPNGTAVLMCSPFGWDDMCSYRIRREWAEVLASEGFGTLRIDLPGSGDSEGHPRDPGQLEAWTDAVRGASAWLAEHDGTRRVAAIGIGLGGALAARAALGGAPIDDLVLWSVPCRGKTIVRELRAFARLEAAGAGEPPSDLPVAEQDRGGLCVNGYVLSEETLRDLEQLDLAADAAGPVAASARALLLGRDGIDSDQALADALEQAGTAVERAEGPGYGAMMAEAQDAVLPRTVIELVSGWLHRGVAQRSSLPAPGRPAPDTHEELLMDHDGAMIRERTVRIAGPSGEMFGILAEPVGPSQGMTIVLTNAGPQRRTGPNRMWVEIARRWAARGIPSLRFDADGIGDADGDATVLGRVTAFYRPSYVEQTRAAVQALADLGMPPRFVMVGLCAGAYWSAQTALADDRVRALVMLNPRTLVFDEWRHTLRRTRQLRTKALRAATWRKVLRGDIHLSKHLETGRTLLARAVQAPRRAGARIAEPRGHQAGGKDGAPTGSESIEALFDALGERGQRTALLFTGSEVLRDELTRSGALERMDRWPGIELTLAGSDVETHTLTPLWLQQQVHELIDRFLESEVPAAVAP